MAMTGKVNGSFAVALRREARTQPGRRWRLTVNPDVAAALRGAATTALCEQRFGLRS
jgi:hypothetical protein